MRVVLRIRTGPEKRVRPDRPSNRRLAAQGASVVLPFALVSFLLCAWRWAYELDWIGLFPFSHGLLSHWQLWFLAGVLAQSLAVKLWRYGTGTDERSAELRGTPARAR